LSRELLLYNVTCNDFSNVKIVASFVSDSAGFVDLEDIGTYSEKSDKAAHRRARKQSIDDVLRELNISELNVLKMDIEGEEVNALRGQRFLSTLRELCVEVHGKANEETVLEILEREGFVLRTVGWRVKMGNLARKGLAGVFATIGAEINTRAYGSRFIASALMNRGSGAGIALRENKVYYGVRG